MTTIELGDARHLSEVPAPPIDRRRITRAVLAAVAVAAVLAAGGSARPAPPGGLHDVWSIPVAETDMTGFGPDNAVVSGPDAITAYDLATGAVRWTVPGRTIAHGPEPAGDLVLLRSDLVTIMREYTDGTVASLEYTRTTVALDAATGAERWRTTGDRGPSRDGTALFEERDEQGELTRLRLLRLADGTSVWSRRVAGVWGWTATEDADGRPTRVVTADRDGLVTVRRFTDGTLVRRGHLARDAARQLGGTAVHLLPVGSLLSVVRFDAPDTASTLHRPDDLAPLWSTETSDRGVQSCGPVVCGVDESGLIAFDPATGRELWRRPGMRTGRPVGPGRLLLDDTQEEPTYLLVDAATGRAVSAGMRGQGLWAEDSPETMLLLRHPGLLLRHTGEPHGRISVTRIDLRSGKQTLLGLMPPAPQISCWDRRPYLACRRDGRLVVTAVRGGG